MITFRISPEAERQLGEEAPMYANYPPANASDKFFFRSFSLFGKLTMSIAGTFPQLTRNVSVLQFKQKRNSADSDEPSDGLSRGRSAYFSANDGLESSIKRGSRPSRTQPGFQSFDMIRLLQSACRLGVFSRRKLDTYPTYGLPNEPFDTPVNTVNQHLGVLRQQCHTLEQ